MSSRYPRETGAEANGWRVSPSVPLLAQVLKARGYRTAAVLGAYPLDRKTGLARGFDHYDDHFMPAAEEAAKDGDRYDYHRRGDKVVDLALEHIETFEEGEPWFLWLHFWDAHSPYYATGEYVGYFETGEELAAVAVELKDTRFSAYRVNRYTSAIRCLDSHLGRLFEELDDGEILGRALIVITADHGEDMGEHGYYGHGRHVYESEVRVPLIVRFPGDENAGRVVGAHAEGIDIAPTIYDFVNAPPSRGARGKSLLPLSRGESPDDDRPGFSVRSWFPPERPKGADQWAPGDTAGVIRGPWKFISHSALDDELYNIEDDPHEQSNVLAGNPERTAAMESLARDYLEMVGPKPRKAPEMNAETVKGLKALGYIQD